MSRIVLCCRTMPHHRPSGMGFVCHDRAMELARQKHDVFVFCAGPRKVLSQGGVTVAQVGGDEGEYSSWYADGCRRWCHSLEPDLIHLDGFDVSHKWWTEFGCRKAVTVHGTGWGEVLTQWNRHLAVPMETRELYAEQECLRTFDSVIGPSQHLAWQLSDIYNHPNTWCVQNPIPRHFFDNTTDPPNNDPRTFLFAGLSDHTTKRVETAKEAASRAGVQLMIADKVPREDMPKLYDLADALVLPTCDARGSDLAVDEALARRRPVICTRTGSCYWRWAHGGPVLAVSRNSIDELSAAMRGQLPVVPDNAAEASRPDVHVESWLTAVNP